MFTCNYDPKNLEIKVLFHHYKKYNQTECEIQIIDWELKTTYAARGIANCSEKDSFNRTIGRKISYKRALAKLAEITNYGGDKIFKLFMWYQYFIHHSKKERANFKNHFISELFSGKDVKFFSVWKILTTDEKNSLSTIDWDILNEQEKNSIS